MSFDSFDYRAFDINTGATLGYVVNCANRRVAVEKAWARWGGASRVEPLSPPFDWRDRQIDVIH
jgi:hypothetical protein